MARRTICAVGAVALLAACAHTEHAPAATSSVVASPTSFLSPPAPVAAPPATGTKNWFDLDVGDCVAAVPAVEIGEVDTPVVDCAGPHQAEVYLRAPTAVNTAIADVANDVCTDGLPAYIGDLGPDGLLMATYLIDSNQDRTDDNPMPSTIICLLQAAGGGELTGSKGNRGHLH